MTEIKRGEIKWIYFKERRVPYTQFVWDNNIQIAVIGIDFRDYPEFKLEVEDMPQIKVERMGKLSEAPVSMQATLMQVLLSIKWNTVYMNPEIVMLTKQV